MNLVYLPLAAWLPAAVLWAGPDPTFEPAFLRIRDGLSRFEDAESTTVELPAPSMSLGQATNTYQCWRLLLTGTHGKQVLELMQRIKSVHDSISDLKGKLAKDLDLYAASAKPDPVLEQRITSEDAALEPLLSSYKSLVETGEKNELIRKAEKGFFREHSAIIPRMKNDDYTMVYDDSTPECKAGGGGGAPGTP